MVEIIPAVYNQKVMTNKGWLSLYIMTIVILGGLNLFLFFSSKHNPVVQNDGTDNCSYQYINPLRCEPNLAENKKEYVVLRNSLLQYIAEEKRQGVVTDVAVYFRDLENGPSININDQLSFAPASLLKLPLMIAYYKKAEDNPSLLQKQITIPKDIQPMTQDIKPQQIAQKGGTYTIDNLITILITQSDNIAWTTLIMYLEKTYPQDDFVSTLSDLGIIDPAIATNEQAITVQSYAAIFRLLYNSSYLNLQMSNKALKLLTQTEFKNGIVAGVPSDIQVAHKFGERENGDDQQLHDCGIVYFKPNPYIICIMTRGHNLADLTQVIQYISQNVYTEVKSRN